MSVLVELWTNWECNSGARQGIIVPVTARTSTNLLNEDTLTLTAFSDAPWIADLALRKIIRVTDELDNVTEWRVAEIEDGASDEEQVVITARSPLYDLADTVMADTTTGGRTWYNLGAVSLTPAQYIDYFVLPALTDAGVTYFARGTVDPALLYSIAWDKWTPLQLLNELVTQTGCELAVRRNGSTSYYIDLLDARGSAASQVLLHTGKNLRSVHRKRRTDPYRNALITTGAVATGEVEAATIGRATWVVTATATGAITVADPNDTTLSPVAFADQLNGLYLLKTNAALATITDSTTAGVITCDVSNVAVGDHIEFRADADGTLLTELSNPAQVATYGRVVGTYEVGGARGERNHAVNPAAESWTNTAEGHYGYVEASCTTYYMATLSVAGLPADTTYLPGDAFHWYEYAQSGGVVPDMRVVAATVTTDATGGCNIALSGTVADSRQFSDFVIFRVTGYMPDGWTTSTATNPRIEVVTRTGPMDGVQTTCYLYATGSTVRGAWLSNLTTGTPIYAGDWLDTGMVAKNYTADGSDPFAVTVREPISLTTTLKTVRRPTTLSPSGSPNAIIATSLPYDTTSSDGITEPPWLQTPSIRIKYDPTTPTLWGSVAYTLMAPSTCVLDAATYNASTVGYPVKIGIMDASGTATALATLVDVARTLSPFVCEDVTLRTSYTMAADRTVALRIKPAQKDSASASPAPCATYIRSVMLHLGEDPAAPYVVGSHANQLWHAANNKLLDVSVEPVTYEIDYLDLARMAGWTEGHEELTLGGTVRIYDQARGIDDEVRVVGLDLDLYDPSNTVVTLASISERLATILARQRAAIKQWVGVNTAAAGDDPTVVYAPTQQALPVTVEGAYRGTDDGTGAVTIAPYVP